MLEALLLAGGVHWLNRHARGRGHRGPWWGLLGVVAYVIIANLIHGPIMRWVRVADPVKTSWTGDPIPVPDSTTVKLLDALLPGLLAMAAAFSLVAVLTPRVQGRVAGTAARSRVNFDLLGWALILLGMVPFAVAIGMTGADPDLALITAGIAPTLAVGGFMLVDAGRYARYLGARNRLPSAEEVLVLDPRRPVVFLRAFGIDERRARVGGQLMTLEEVVGPPIFWHVGPFIAVGNPDDYIAAGGAAKSYQANESWQGYVTAMVQRASCVLVAEGGTRGLGWELGLLRATLEPRRVFFVTIPRSDGRPSESWPAFLNLLRQAGFQPPEGDVPPGALLGCDESWRLRVVPAVGADLGTTLASQVPEAALAQGLAPASLLPLIRRQGAPRPFARSVWRYVAMAVVAKGLVLLVAASGAGAGVMAGLMAVLGGVVVASGDPARGGWSDASTV